MDNISWKSWVFRACVHIRFKPDREAVQEELLAHLEDKAEDIRQEKDLPVSEAEQQALAAMGDADEVGRRLAAVHKPWLGYLWLWSRRVLILCIVVVIWAAFGFSERAGFRSADLRWWQENLPYREGNEQYIHRTELSPDCRDTSDGYTFTVPAAVRFHNEDYTAEYEGVPYEVEANTALYVTVRATSWLPGTDECDAFFSLYAVDDLGNHYWSVSDSPGLIYTWQYDQSLRGNYHATDPWTTVYEASIVSIDPSASWIELRYDRDGRDVRLRIGLTGGESQ